MIYSLIQITDSLTNGPNITDWLQAWGTIVAAVISIPGAIIAFIILFRKDKDKQIQIDKLVGIVDELKNQTMQFSYQTELMRETNEILREQMQTQNDVLRGDKEYKDKMREIEERKQKAQFRPSFKFSRGQSSSREIDIVINNYGERAILKDFKCIDDDKVFVTTPKNLSIEKNSSFHLSATYHGENNLHNFNKLIEVYYEDSIGTKYKQIFNVRGSHVDILPPDEIK